MFGMLLISNRARLRAGMPLLKLYFWGRTRLNPARMRFILQLLCIFELQVFPAARSNKPRVSLPPARQLAYEGANSRLERRFAGKDHPLRIHKGLSMGRPH
jgi:hypothetical protein